MNKNIRLEQIKQSVAREITEVFGELTEEQVIGMYETLQAAVERELYEQDDIFALISPSEHIGLSARVRALHCRWASLRGEDKGQFRLGHEEAGILFDELQRLTKLLNRESTKSKGQTEAVLSAEGVRMLPEASPRVETGPVQFGQDWPGVFIRGDNAACYAMNLRLTLNGTHDDVFVKATLQGLLSDLSSSYVLPAPLKGTAGRLPGQTAEDSSSKDD